MRDRQKSLDQKATFLGLKKKERTHQETKINAKKKRKRNHNSEPKHKRR